MNDIEYIRSKLDMPELLTQVAEEAAELVQAALKLRRAIDGTNPTPNTVQECMDAFNTEFGDVLNAITVAFPQIVQTLPTPDKIHRWANRLKAEDTNHASETL